MRVRKEGKKQHSTRKKYCIFTSSSCRGFPATWQSVNAAAASCVGNPWAAAVRCGGFWGRCVTYVCWGTAASWFLAACEERHGLQTNRRKASAGKRKAGKPHGYPAAILLMGGRNYVYGTKTSKNVEEIVLVVILMKVWRGDGWKGGFTAGKSLLGNYYSDIIDGWEKLGLWWKNEWRWEKQYS